MKESAWLIELGESPVNAPDYWIGQFDPSKWPHGLWNPDHQIAVRFCRKQDAERVAKTIPVVTRVCEHGWSGPGLCDRAGEGQMNSADRICELEAFCRLIIRTHAQTPQPQWIVQEAVRLVPDEPADDYSFAGQGDEEPSS